MKSLEEIEQSIKKLTVESGAQIHDRILGKLERKLDASERQGADERTPGRRVITISRVGGLAAACLIIASSLVCLLLSRKVTDLENQLELARAHQNVTVPEPDNSTTINLYLKEHQDVAIRATHASRSTPLPARVGVDRHDILYYEFMDDPYENTRPGIIVRGPLSQGRISSPEAPVISNGHTLTLSEARKTADFALQAPARLHPGYSLDQIRRIDGRDALQLLYTDGINSVSLFEQPLDGQRGLSRQDFREYAVYRNAEQGAGTILAWRDDALSYVLIGNTEMTQLMNMAQSISATR